VYFRVVLFSLLFLTAACSEPETLMLLVHEWEGGRQEGRQEGREKGGRRRRMGWTTKKTRKGKGVYV